jgi:predicted RNase H-like HicB family nuclease
VEELPAEWDGGWLAWIPMLAGKATGAYGETREEALKELEEIKRLLLEDRL